MCHGDTHRRANHFAIRLDIVADVTRIMSTRTNMFFSAGFDNYRCPECSTEWSNIVPTSIVPMTACCAFSGAFWAKTIENFLEPHWLYKLCGFVIAFLSLWACYELIDRTTNRWLRKKRCPSCKAALTHIGSGFYDGLVPNPWELVLYAATIAVAVSVWAVAA